MIFKKNIIVRNLQPSATIFCHQLDLFPSVRFQTQPKTFYSPRSALYFPKVYFPKVHFPKVYFPIVYFSKVYFPKVYFPKVYFPKCFFITLLPVSKHSRKLFTLHIQHCIFPKCIFPECIFQSVFYYNPFVRFQTQPKTFYSPRSALYFPTVYFPKVYFPKCIFLK